MGTLRRRQSEASQEIGKLLREFKGAGRITTSRATFRPKSRRAAVKQAAAIAYAKHGLGRAGKSKRRKER